MAYTQQSAGAQQKASPLFQLALDTKNVFHNVSAELQRNHEADLRELYFLFGISAMRASGVKASLKEMTFSACFNF
jgi:hypothetical protein